MKCVLHVFDEINVAFDGLSNKHIDKIIKNTKLPKKGAHMTAAFQLKIDDGKESNFFENGRTFFYMLDTVLPMVVDFGYDVEIKDYRKSMMYIYEPVDNNFISVGGKPAYDHQVEAVNAVIDERHGIIDVSTSGGKTIITAMITKVFEKELDFLIIVPTETLVLQTYETFVEQGIDVGRLKKGMTKKQQEKEWGHKHLICTWRILNNNKERLSRFGGFVYDEAHIMGDVIYNIMENELSGCFVRVGMTASVPDDKLKKQKLCCHIGGDVLIKVKPSELQEKKIISTCDIEMYPIKHYFDMIGEWDWDLEEQYLNTNKQRLDIIADFISKLEKKNTLILCFKKQARKLSEMLGIDYIDGDVNEKDRQRYYKRFREETDFKLVATYDTIGTGLSIDEILLLVTVDIGKNGTRIIQGIGRGLRKDGDVDHLKVLDLYSKLYVFNRMTGKWNDFSYSGKKHVNARKRQYNDLAYPFKEVDILEIKEK